MSVTYVNWTSRVAVAGRVAELRCQSHSSNEPMIHGDYHLPFGKIEGADESPQVDLARIGARSWGQANGTSNISNKGPTP